MWSMTSYIKGGMQAKGHLSRVLRQSRLSDNKNIPGAVYRSPAQSLTAEENPIKPQLGDRQMKGLCDQ